MASQQRPPRTSSPSDRSQISFDPTRLRLPQAAIIGFVVGVLFHACVIFAVLDDGTSATSNDGTTPEIVTNPQSTPVATVPVDRTNCDQIRGTDYRSETERQWFQQNCT